MEDEQKLDRIQDKLEFLDFKSDKEDLNEGETKQAIEGIRLINKMTQGDKVSWEEVENLEIVL